MKRDEASWSAWPNNLVWGLCYGVGAGVAFSLYVGVISLIPSSRALEKADMSLGQVVFVYLASGLAGGIILGVMRPLLRTTFGQMLLGFLVILNFGMLIEWTTEPRSLALIFREAWMLAAILGPAYALGMRVHNHYFDRH